MSGRRNTFCWLGVAALAAGLLLPFWRWPVVCGPGAICRFLDPEERGLTHRGLVFEGNCGTLPHVETCVFRRVVRKGTPVEKLTVWMGRGTFLAGLVTIALAVGSRRGRRWHRAALAAAAASLAGALPFLVLTRPANASIMPGAAAWAFLAGSALLIAAALAPPSRRVLRAHTRWLAAEQKAVEPGRMVTRS